jgi:hypothetical protein
MQRGMKVHGPSAKPAFEMDSNRRKAGWTMVVASEYYCKIFE